jgi:GNAT superfamily N-acetyltransferase
VNELERVEAQALRDAVLLGGGRAQTAGGAMCLAHPRARARLFNRAYPLGAVVDVAAIASWYGDHPHEIASPPGYLGLDEQLRAAGYEPGGAVAKHQRSTDGVAAAETGLRVAETTDGAAFEQILVEGYEAPPETFAGTSAFVGGPGWQCFLAWDGDRAAACGALYVDGDVAWLGAAATRPAFRGRGAQAALVAARLRRARELGATRAASETSLDGASLRNLRRAGFQQAYTRAHWRRAA